MWVNQDALSRIQKFPVEFVSELLNAIAGRQDQSKICVAGFKPAATVKNRDLDRPPY